MAFTIQSAGAAYFAVSDLLRARHAFATRHGGVSPHAHTATLNLAFGRGDGDAVVRENLSRLSAAVGFDARAVVSGPQIHGNIVHRVGAAHRGMGYDRAAEPLAGDGYVTTESGVVPGVKTADCTPILLEARVGDVPVAVAALHAGWKGTVGDIAGVGVSMLREAVCEAAGGRTAEPVIYAAIGPCIHPCCFEVQADCVAVVRERLGDLCEPFIGRIPTGYTLDLPGLNRALLLRAGVSEECIDISPDCTACRTDLYFSHRAQRGVRGTMLSVITLDSGAHE